MLFANMNSTDTIALPIRLYMEMLTYIIPTIPKFRTHPLVLKRIRNSHNPRYVGITHYPKGYIFIPFLFKRIRYCFAVSEEGNSSKYRWKLVSEETICEKAFIKFIGRYLIHKVCIFLIH